MSVSTFLYNSSQSLNSLTPRDVRIAFFCGRRDYETIEWNFALIVSISIQLQGRHVATISVSGEDDFGRGRRPHPVAAEGILLRLYRLRAFSLSASLSIETCIAPPACNLRAQETVLLLPGGRALVVRRIGATQTEGPEPAIRRPRRLHGRCSIT
jgi:hypothetical protein